MSYRSGNALPPGEDGLADLMHPLAELPRTSTGKVRRLDLPGVLGLDGT